jgi:hypothetical protein
MFIKLRDSFTDILRRLKTHRILKVYEKADLPTQSKMIRKEIQRVGKNKYNMEAYLRLSIMRPSKSQHYENSLQAIGVTPTKIKTQLTYLQTRYSDAYNALLKPSRRHA